MEKLGARAISADEAEQLLRNAHITVRNPGDDPGSRRLLIGQTDGGRTLTLVIEQTLDPTTAQKRRRSGHGRRARRTYPPKAGLHLSRRQAMRRQIQVCRPARQLLLSPMRERLERFRRRLRFEAGKRERSECSVATQGAVLHLFVSIEPPLQRRQSQHGGQRRIGRPCSHRRNARPSRHRNRRHRSSPPLSHRTAGSS